MQATPCCARGLCKGLPKLGNLDNYYTRCNYPFFEGPGFRLSGFDAVGRGLPPHVRSGSGGLHLYLQTQDLEGWPPFIEWMAPTTIHVHRKIGEDVSKPLQFQHPEADNSCPWDYLPTNLPTPEQRGVNRNVSGS